MRRHARGDGARVPPLVRLILVGLAVASGLSSIVACNAVLGVEDVRLKRNRDGGSEEEEDGADPEPESDGEAPARPNVLQTALGEQHTCARKPDRTVRCWGNDVQGQTGSGGPADGGFVTTPQDVAGITDAVDIASGRNHTCVARESGKVSCWGYNLDGQLGNGESANRSATPVDVAGITNAFAVAAGGNFSCALRGSGSVACWGGNGSGQLGTGNQTSTTTPVAVTGLSSIVAIAAGQAHVCAVSSSGKVSCWGDGANGQLGSGKPTSSPSPVAVENLPEAVMVAAAERSTCALTRTGSVFCWGANELGQLGTGAPNANPNPAPIVVTNLSDATALWTGRNHACAVRKSGAVVCWGAGSRGQLGDGQPRPDGGGTQASFVVVSGIQNAIGISAGG
ncbi:MAG: repeat domain protein, partial [Labilithrix sp.]|nr:repeat domain protein [Labilithrix sp.]